MTATALSTIERGLPADFSALLPLGLQFPPSNGACHPTGTTTAVCDVMQYLQARTLLG